MKIIYSDFKNNELKLKAENEDDVFTLSSVVSAGDVIKGLCERKVKVGSGERTKSIKKTYLAEILAEKIDFDKNAFQLRVNGKILQEFEDIPKGSYQTIEVGEGSVITIKKEKFLSYHLQKLREASEEMKTNTLLVLFDRESALFALMKKSGYEVLLKMEGEVAKKRFEVKKPADFFSEIAKQMQEYSERRKITTIVLAGPAFWKDELMGKIKDSSLKKKIVYVTCNSVTESGINEILKGEELSKILKRERAAVENLLVENVLKEISKSGAVAYGEREVKAAIEQSNVKILVLTDKFFLKKGGEEAKNFDLLVKMCEQKRAEIHFISSEHEGGKKLDGLGGIAALLRYKSYS